MNYLKEATTDAADIKLIHNLANECFYATYAAILSPQQLDYMFEMMYAPHNIIKQITQENHRYFIIYHNQIPVGYISLERVNPVLFNLQKIYLLPSAQGLGLGRKMVEFAKEFVKNEKGIGTADLELHVNRGNKAQDFYKKMGFAIKLSNDFDIGNGYFMNDYIMVVKID